MTGNTLEQRARELLAAEYERDERHDDARMLRDGLTCNAWSIALRAIEAALRLSDGADVSRLLAAWYEQGIRQGMRVQSPGHAHDRPGIWDDDNGKLAGVECAACALWKIAAQLAAAPRHETGEG